MLLSRQESDQINLTTMITEGQQIPLVLNQFKKQIEIEKSDHNSITTDTIFSKYKNHKIKFVTLDNLIAYIRLYPLKRSNLIFVPRNSVRHFRRQISY